MGYITTIKAIEVRLMTLAQQVKTFLSIPPPPLGGPIHIDLSGYGVTRGLMWDEFEEYMVHNKWSLDLDLFTATIASADVP